MIAYFMMPSPGAVVADGSVLIIIALVAVVIVSYNYRNNLLRRDDGEVVENANVMSDVEYTKELNVECVKKQVKDRRVLSDTDSVEEDYVRPEEKVKLRN